MRNKPVVFIARHPCMGFVNRNPLMKTRRKYPKASEFNLHSSNFNKINDLRHA